MIRYFTSICTMLAVMTLFSGKMIAQPSDSLNHYLREAALRNPGVQAEFTNYQASLQKIPQAKAYPDPKLDIGFFLEPMDIIGGKQVAQVSVMQMFPWFGTQKAAQSEATHMAQMAFEKFRETRDNLYLEVYTQWYALCSLQQQLKNSRANKVLLSQLELLAVRKYASPTAGSGNSYATSPRVNPAATASPAGNSMSGMTAMNSSAMQAPSSSASMPTMNSGGSMTSMGGNQGGMSSVLRIQMEMAELDNHIERILSELEAKKARFNALLNRPADKEVFLPDTIIQQPYLFDTREALQTLGNRNPMLKMIQEEGDAYAAKGKMQKKMSYPMVGIGLQYMLNKKTSNTMFGMGDMNGKDMVMPMVSLSLPIYRGKYKAQQRESQLQRQASQQRYSDVYLRLESELYQNRHLLDDAARKMNLYTRQSQLAQNTYHLIVQEFAAGKTDLTNVIEVRRQLLDYQLKQSEAAAEYNTLAATIQKIISFNVNESFQPIQNDENN